MARVILNRRAAENSALPPKISGSGWKRVRGAAAVLHLADVLDLARRLAARIGLAVEHLVARDLDDQVVGERVDHRDADAVEAARGLVGLAVELAAGVERRHDDLERRAAGEFRVVLDRDAAAVVGDGDDSRRRRNRTSMRLAWPAIASSIELSMTSAKRWWSALESVPPIYMPGRRRTGSSPSSTSMSAAE